MAWLTYLFGSGLAFYIGIACVLLPLPLSLSAGRGSRAVSNVSAGVGLVVIVLSGTPLPLWFYRIAIAATLIGLGVLQSTRLSSRRHKIGLALLVALVWLAAAASELPHQLQPKLKASPSRRLFLIGDSISAGLKTDDPAVWPKLLANQHDVDVVDHSRAGATAAVALSRTKDVAFGDGIVLVEIGGNDLLGSTPAEDFGRNLDTLLSRVCVPGRQVVMFELPIPPLGNAYGRIQRELAAQYHVQLIPKRTLMGILTADGATIDSLHLTPMGHQRMAEAVWKVVGPAYGNN